ncbi:hypothetical protein EMIT0P265_90011 [Pseudomonas zeae]
MLNTALGEFPLSICANKYLFSESDIDNFVFFKLSRSSNKKGIKMGHIYLIVEKKPS